MRGCVLAAAVALSLLGTAAHASSVLTFTGTISNGFDFGGFGIGSSTNVVDLTGDNFTLVYTIDSSVTTAPSLPNVASVSGPNVVQATLTIDGVTHQFASDFLSNEDVTTMFGTPGIVSASTSGTDPAGPVGTSALVLSFAHNIAPTASLTAPFSYTVQAGDTESGDFEINSANGTASGNFNITEVSISAAAVPEPGAWALMLLGVGALGMTLRGRRSVIA